MSSQCMERIGVRVDHGIPVVATGLACALGGCPQFDVRLGGVDGPEPSDRVDVVVADPRRALAWLGAGRPRHAALAGARVLVLGDSDGEADVRAALMAGVYGYVLVNCQLDELIASVMLTARGSRYLCASASARLAESMAHQSLTQRESDVLSLLVDGCSNKVIARRLEIAVGTVKAHARAIFEKLNVGSRMEAVAVAASRGLVGATQGGAEESGAMVVAGARLIAQGQGAFAGREAMGRGAAMGYH